MFSVFFCLLFCVSTVSGAFAAEKNSDDMNDFGHYSIASKIVYLMHGICSVEVGVIPEDLHTLADVASYFTGEKHHITGVVVNTTLDNLKPGDILHVKNNPYPFMIYRGKGNLINPDSNQVILETLSGMYTCDMDTFNQIFDGKAVKLVHIPSDKAITDKYQINGTNITDTAVYDPSVPSPVY